MLSVDPVLIRVVREDLEYLLSQWSTGAVEDDELRRNSTVLRRLLSAHDVMKVWAMVAGKRDFLVPSTALEIRHPDRLGEVELATSSPARTSLGMTISAAFVFRVIQTGDEPVRLGPKELLPITKFIFQKTVVVDGVAISRNDVVQFVANKLGGAHYDVVRQKPSEKALDSLQHFFLGERPVVIHEMLSYGQELAQSASAAELLAALRK